MGEARDRHDVPIAEGDVVDAVYGGDHHAITVERISESHGHAFIHGSVRVRLPAAGVAVRRERKPIHVGGDAPKDETPRAPRPGRSGRA